MLSGNLITRGISPGREGTLTISGTGALTIRSEYGAGIGAGDVPECGNIVIKMGISIYGQK